MIIKNLDNCKPHPIKYFENTSPHNKFDLSADKNACKYLLGWNALQSILRPTSREGDEGLKLFAWCLWKKYCETNGGKNEH